MTGEQFFGFSLSKTWYPPWHWSVNSRILLRLMNSSIISPLNPFPWVKRTVVWLDDCSPKTPWIIFIVSSSSFSDSSRRCCIQYGWNLKRPDRRTTQCPLQYPPFTVCQEQLAVSTSCTHNPSNIALVFLHLIVKDKEMNAFLPRIVLPWRALSQSNLYFEPSGHTFGLIWSCRIKNLFQSSLTCWYPT